MLTGRWAVALLVVWQATTQTADDLEKRGQQALTQGHYREALAAFEAVLTREPQRTSARFGKGMALVGLLDYGGAVAAFEQAVEIDPHFGDAWRELMVLYPQIGQGPDACIAFKKIRQLGKLPDEERLVLARALRKSGCTDDALEALGSPGRPWTPAEHLELGLIASEQGDNAGAVEHLGHAVATPSEATAEAEYRYGRALEATERSEEALAAYRRALEQDPRYRSARFRLGNLLLRMGRKEEGQALLHDYETYRLWDRRVKLLKFMVTSGKLTGEEDRSKTVELVRLLLQGGVLDEAGPLIAAGLVRHPGDKDLLVARAWWLVSSGKRKLAREALEPLLQRKDAPGDALWLAARIDLAEGRVTEAAAMFERVLAVDPNPPARLLEELGGVYAKAGRVREAETTFRRALEKAVGPERAKTHAALGALLASQGRVEEAEQQLRHAHELDPNLVAVQRSLGGLLVRRGALEEAEVFLRTSVRLHPGDPQLRRTLALALEGLGRSEEAAVERKAADEIEARRKHR